MNNIKKIIFSLLFSYIFNIYTSLFAAVALENFLNGTQRVTNEQEIRQLHNSAVHAYLTTQNDLDNGSISSYTYKYRIFRIEGAIENQLPRRTFNYHFLNACRSASALPKGMESKVISDKDKALLKTVTHKNSEKAIQRILELQAQYQE